METRSRNLIAASIPPEVLRPIRWRDEVRWARKRTSWLAWTDKAVSAVLGAGFTGFMYDFLGYDEGVQELIVAAVIGGIVAAIVAPVFVFLWNLRRAPSGTRDERISTLHEANCQLRDEVDKYRLPLRVRVLLLRSEERSGGLVITLGDVEIINTSKEEDVRVEFQLRVDGDRKRGFSGFVFPESASCPPDLSKTGLTGQVDIAPRGVLLGDIVFCIDPEAAQLLFPDEINRLQEMCTLDIRDLLTDRVVSHKVPTDNYHVFPPAFVTQSGPHT